MGRPFAMWVNHATPTNIRGPQVLLSGAVVGRAPEQGDRLNVIAPLCAPFRLRCRSVVGAPRGAESAPFTFGVEPVAELDDARTLVGSVVAEDGCQVVAYGARLHAPRPRLADAVRFEFGRDHAWGLIDIRHDALNLVVVGGGLPDDDFWSSLTGIQPQTSDRLSRTDFEPLWPAGLGPRVWRVPTIKTFERQDDLLDLVIRTPGPVDRDRAKIFVDDDVRLAMIYQQPALTKLRIPRGPSMDTASVGLPFLFAA